MFPGRRVAVTGLVLGLFAGVVAESDMGSAFGHPVGELVQPGGTRTQANPPIPTTTAPFVDRRGFLLRDRTLGAGQLRFEPPGSDRPRSSSGLALTTASRSLRVRPKSDRPEQFFALFSASSPTTRKPDGTAAPLFDRRPVWVVRFPNVIGQRQSGIVQRRNIPTTTSFEVTTEIVVILDDRSGKVVLTSEYLPQEVPASGATTTVRPADGALIDHA